MALLQADIPASSKFVYVAVQDNYAQDTLTEFWDRLLQLNQVGNCKGDPKAIGGASRTYVCMQLWLYNERNVGPLHPNLLPTNLTRLANNPYRSLAWAVRNNGGYGSVKLVTFVTFQPCQLCRCCLVKPVTTLCCHCTGGTNISFADFVWAAYFASHNLLPGPPSAVAHPQVRTVTSEGDVPKRGIQALRTPDVGAAAQHQLQLLPSCTL